MRAYSDLKQAFINVGENPSSVSNYTLTAPMITIP